MITNGSTVARSALQLSVPPSDQGLRSFPTVACGRGAAPCRVCHECGNDCIDCAVCAAEECQLCLVPDLTPRTANTLATAGLSLAANVRELMPGSARPVFMHHLLRAFEELTDQLTNGIRPWPSTLAEQMCLYLMISHGTELACSVGEVFNVGLPYSDYDYYFDRLYDTLLLDDEHMFVIDTVKPVSRPDLVFDFEGLAATVSDALVSRLLAPLALQSPVSSGSGEG